MKNVLQEYTPFEHSNLNYINGLINYARQQKQTNTAEGIFSACVIYANLVEYLVKNLLSNLKQMVYLVSFFQFGGVMFMKNNFDRFNESTLGALKNELNNYEFPDKPDFQRNLDEFLRSRNSLFHRLMDKTTQEEVNKLDKDVIDIQNKAEELLQKYNVITNGLGTSWTKIAHPLPVPQT